MSSQPSSTSASNNVEQSRLYLLETSTAGDNQAISGISTMKTKLPAQSTEEAGNLNPYVIAPTDEVDKEDANPVENPEAEPSSVDQGKDNPPEKEDPEEEPSGFLMTDMLKLCWKLYMEDSKEAQLVRGRILGLPAGQIPDRAQMNNYKIFAMRTPKEGPNFKETLEEGGKVPAHNVSGHWLNYLQEQETLGDCASEDFQPPTDFPKIYTAEGLKEYIPDAVKNWGNKPIPSLTVLVPHNTIKIFSDHFLSALHSKAALQRVSIGSGDNQKQFACCPYCGVRSENQGSSHSHARWHLNYELLCKSCLAYHNFSIGAMMKHLDECKKVIELRNKTPASSTRGST